MSRKNYLILSYDRTLLTFLGIFLASCTLFRSEIDSLNSAKPTKQAILSETTEKPDTKSLSQVEVQALPQRQSGRGDSVTIKWLVPETPLDGYVIRYGFSPQSLEYEERLRWSSLKTQTNSDKKEVFVHSLNGLPGEQVVFLSLAGILNDQLSPPSEIYSVQPLRKESANISGAQ